MIKKTFNNDVQFPASFLLYVWFVKLNYHWKKASQIVGGIKIIHLQCLKQQINQLRDNYSNF